MVSESQRIAKSLPGSFEGDTVTKDTGLFQRTASLPSSKAASLSHWRKAKMQRGLLSGTSLSRTTFSPTLAALSDRNKTPEPKECKQLLTPTDRRTGLRPSGQELQKQTKHKSNDKATRLFIFIFTPRRTVSFPLPGPSQNSS